MLRRPISSIATFSYASRILSKVHSQSFFPFCIFHEALPIAMLHCAVRTAHYLATAICIPTSFDLFQNLLEGRLLLPLTLLSFVFFLSSIRHNLSCTCPLESENSHIARGNSSLRNAFLSQLRCTFLSTTTFHSHSFSGCSPCLTNFSPGVLSNRALCLCPFCVTFFLSPIHLSRWGAAPNAHCYTVPLTSAGASDSPESIWNPSNSWAENPTLL